MQNHKSYRLNFAHISARVTVMREEDGYFAFIVFPKAYIKQEFNFRLVDEILAPDFDKAYEMAAMQFKEFFSCLDQRIREIGRHNFFVSRVLFRNAVNRSVDDFTAAFVYTNQYYAFSENVDGQKWMKSKFMLRHELNTKDCVLFINKEHVFLPMLNKGFDIKFIERLVSRNNKVKVNQLRISEEGLLIDELERHPERLYNHIADHREDFEIALGLHKLRHR